MDITAAQKPDIYIDGELIPTLFCDSVILNLAPTASQAHLTYHYGEIAINGKFQIYRPRDFSNSLIEIKLAAETLFSGIVQPVADAADGSKQYDDAREAVKQGTTGLTAYAYDYLLDRVPVDVTYFESFDVSRIIPFNGAGADLEKNRSAALEGDCYSFTQKNGGSVWSVLDIINYLLINFADLSGIAWKLSGQYSALSKIQVQFDPTGKTVRQCLSELLSRETGYSFYAALNGDFAELRVVSLSDIDITIDGDTVIPANENQYNGGESFEYSAGIANLQITKVEESCYGKIKVTSEPVRVMCTLDIAAVDSGSALLGDWSPSDKTAYDAATDMTRGDEQYDAVYQQYVLAANWDGTDYAGHGIIPEVTPADCAVELGTTGGLAHLLHTFDRTLPIEKTNTTRNRKEFRKPFLLLKFNDKFVISDKAAESMKVGFNILDRAPGILLNGSMNHVCSKSEFTAKSEIEPVYDINDALLTCSFFTDSSLTLELTGVSGNSRTKHIHLPGYHYWVAPSGTYIDRDTKTTAKTIYRDDRPKLKKLAAMAKAWYGRARNTVSFSYSRIISTRQTGFIGGIITEIYSGGSFIPVGTVITAVNYDFNRQTIDVVTDFADIDFRSVSRRTLRADAQITAARLASIESRLDNIPLRPVSSGGSSTTAAYAGPFKLKTSVETETPWIHVLNGGDKNSPYCGTVSVGGQLINVPVFDSVIGADSHLVLTVSYEYVDDDATPTYSAAITMKTTVPPELVAGVWSIVLDLGTCAIDEDLNPSSVQAWTGGNVIITSKVV